MSSYYKETQHPVTEKWELALWLDDALGSHRYGVRFPSEPDKTYDPEKKKLETRESAIGRKEAKAPDVQKQSVTYRLSHTIECASASHEEPHLCKDRVIQAEVTVDLPSGAITVKKINAPSNRYGNQASSYSFINSDPEIARAIGWILIAAAEASEHTLAMKNV